VEDVPLVQGAEAVDDLHFLRWRAKPAVEVNQFKYIANDFPVTLLYVGVDL
jgi:hypothetical protein